MIIEKKNKLTVFDIEKELNNPQKSRVFDFAKIDALGFPMVLIMTARGLRGKSLNLKTYLIEKYKTTGQASTWLMNTAKQITKEKGKFLKDLTKPEVAHSIDIEANKKLKVRGNTDDLNTRVVDESNNTVFDLIALNQAEYYKGSRIPPYAIGFDEFNAGSERVSNYIFKFDSLIHSNEDVVNMTIPPKIFWLGNSKSLAHPLIFRLGITKIDKEITTFYNEVGDPFLLVISPVIDEEEEQKIAQRNIKNPFYYLSKQLGTADHAYNNKSLFDEMNFVNPYFTGDGKQNLLISQFQVFHNKMYYTIYTHNSGVERGSVPHFHIRQTMASNESLITICFDKKDLKEGYVIRKDIQANLIKNLIRSNIQFEDTMSRVSFIKSLH